MMFDFSRSTSTNTKEKTPSVEKTTTIVIWSNDDDKITNFINKCKMEEVDRLYPVPLYDTRYIWCMNACDNGSNYDYLRYKWSSLKTFDTLYFPRKQEVINALTQFDTKTGPWDAIHQRAHMCRIFAYGPPDTGKTSLIKAIANMMQRDIIKLSMKYIANDNDLMALVSSDMIRCENTIGSGVASHFTLPLSKRLYVLEDLDCDACEKIIAPRGTVSEEKPPIEETSKPKAKRKESEITLSGFLNMLDGLHELSGAMFFISTNHIELTHMESSEIAKFLKRYYRLDKAPELDLGGKNVTPSRVEQICQVCKTVEDAIVKLSL